MYECHISSCQPDFQWMAGPLTTLEEHDDDSSSLGQYQLGRKRGWALNGTPLLVVWKVLCLSSDRQRIQVPTKQILKMREMSSKAPIIKDQPLSLVHTGMSTAIGCNFFHNKVGKTCLYHKLLDNFHVCNFVKSKILGVCAVAPESSTLSGIPRVQSSAGTTDLGTTPTVT